MEQESGPDQTFLNSSYVINFETHQPFESWKPFKVGSVTQMKPYVRYIPNLVELKSNKTGNKQHLFDFSEFRPIYGSPIGGIGSGTIGRGSLGEFCRYQLKPGIYETGTCYGTGFILTVRRQNQTLYQYFLTRKPTSRELAQHISKFINPAVVTYYTLYPVACYSYDLPFLKLKCRQLSPFLAKNYKDSSMPVGLFEWTALCSMDNMEISLSFLWQSGSGETSMTNCESVKVEMTDFSGIKMSGLYANAPLSFLSAVERNDKGCETTTKTSVNPYSITSSMKLWKELMEHGHVSEAEDIEGKQRISVLTAKMKPEIGREMSVRFVVAWHMPEVRFEDTIYKRFYTRFFNENDDVCVQLAKYAFQNFDKWTSAISDWHNSILSDERLSNTLRMGLFNELYYLADGGTLWVEAMDDDHPFVRENGKFAILESQGLKLYNTLDVLYYASVALIDLFPNLQLSIQYDFAKAVRSEDKQRAVFLTNSPAHRKVLNTCPHDLGSPDEHPWMKLNAFKISNTSDWKDLNAKFILTVYRDFVWTKDLSYLKDMWDVVKILLERLKFQDKDGDGIAENEGADQTFDAWTMKGVSAYCAGLQMCAIKAAVEMASIVDEARVESLRDWLNQSFENIKQRVESVLWNGCYYNFDQINPTIFMSAQLSGLYMLLQTGINVEDIYPAERVKSILRSLELYNLNPRLGFVNGTKSSGSVDKSSIQSSEIWTGITFAILSMFVRYGMSEEASKIADFVIYNYYHEFGFAFQTPESINESRRYRHLGYLRPLAIWSIYVAIRDESENGSDNRKTAEL